jgi:hypothetical protein
MDKFLQIHNTTTNKHGVEYTKAHDLNKNTEVVKRLSEVELSEQMNRIMNKYDVPQEEMDKLYKLFNKECINKTLEWTRDAV